MKERSATDNAERLVLGTCMLDAQAYWKIHDQLQVRHFLKKINREIWIAICDVAERSSTIDYRLVAALLPDEIDGVLVNSYIAVLLTEAAPDDGEIPVVDFVDVLVDSYTRRKGLEAIDKARKKLVNLSENSGEALGELEAAVNSLSAAADSSHEISIGKAAQGVALRVSDAYQKDRRPGLGTGLAALDDLIGPMLPGQLITMIAGSGSGKTALAMQIGMHCAIGDLASPPVDVWFCQADMNAEDLAERQIATDSLIQARMIRSAQLNRAEYDRIYATAQNLTRAHLTIYHRSQPTIGHIMRRCIAARRQNRLGLVIIDHLKCLRADDPRVRGFDRFEYIVPQCKALAKECHVPVLLLTQPTRESQKGDDPRPTINGAYGGGTVEESSDNVFGLFREEAHLRRMEPPEADYDRHSKWQVKIDGVRGLAELSSLKDRFGEANRRKIVKWDGPRTIFSDP